MNLSRIMAALSQRQARGAHGARAAHPYARLAKAMAVHGPGATERAQHESSGHAHSYNGIPNEVAGGFQGDAFDNGGFQT